MVGLNPQISLYPYVPLFSRDWVQLVCRVSCTEVQNWAEREHALFGRNGPIITQRFELREKQELQPKTTWSTSSRRKHWQSHEQRVEQVQYKLLAHPS